MTLTTIAGSQNAIAQTASAGTTAAAISPADSILYVGFSLDTASPQWTLAEELLQRAGVEQTGSDIVGEVGSSATGQDMSDAEAFLGGEGAFVVTSLDAFSDQASSLTDIVGTLDVPTPDAGTANEVGIATEGAPAGWAFILQPSDITSAEQQLDDEVNAAGGGQVTETEYNGATIRSAPANEATGDSAVAYAVVDTFVIISETPEDIEPFVDAAAGDEAALSGVEQFGQADEALAGDRLAFGYLDTTSLTDDITSLDTSGLGLGNSLGDLAGSAGYTGMSLISDPVGFRFETVQIAADGAAAKPRPTPEGLSFAEQVPSDSLIMANGYNLGGGALLQGLGLALVTAVNQGFSSMSDSSTPVAVPSPDELYDQAAQLLGFNLKTGFIDQLIGEYGVAVWGANAEDPSQIGAILTSGVTSPATLSDTLSKLSFLIQAGAQGQANVSTRAVGEYNINTVTIPQDGTDPLIVEYGIIDGKFVLGYGNGVDTYLAGAETSLADNEDYQTAMAALPAEHDGVLYVNVQESMALSESTSLTGDTAFVDSPELCGQYGTQAAAQEAYDADPVANFEMDWDFDGTACEDFFADSTTVASPVAEAPASPVRSFAGVSYVENGHNRTSSILVIAEN